MITRLGKFESNLEKLDVLLADLKELDNESFEYSEKLAEYKTLLDESEGEEFSEDNIGLENSEKICPYLDLYYTGKI